MKRLKMFQRSVKMNSAAQKILKSKAALRKKISKLHWTAGEHRKRSRKLCDQILNLAFFKNAQTIGFYAALPDEMDVLAAAQHALREGKKIFFPRMTGKKMEFHEIKNLGKDLKVGAFKVREPQARAPKRKRALDLIFVPGRAFDQKGRRLGRGLGYYDRLLKKWRASVRVGVAFREQIVRQVPSDKYDMNMDIVISA